MSNSKMQGAFQQHDYFDIEREIEACRDDRRLAIESNKRRYSVAQFWNILKLKCVHVQKIWSVK